MQRSPLRVMYLTLFFDLLGFGLVIPFVPAVARALGADDATAPLLNACFFLAQFLAVPLWGRLSDRIGRRPVLLISFAAAAVGHTAFALTPTLVGAFAARALTGLTSAQILMAQATVGDLVPPEQRARGMSVVGIAFGVGFLFGPPLGGILGQVPGLRHPGSITGLLWAGLSLVNFVIIFFNFREPLARGAAAATPTLGTATVGGRFGELGKALRMPGVGAGLVVAFSFFFWFEGMQQTLANFTADRFGMGLQDTGMLLLWIGVVGIIVQAGFVHRLTRRFGEARLVMVGCLFEGVAMFLVVVSPARHYLFLSGFFGAIGTGLMLPCSSSYISRCADARSQGTALGAMQSATALARILGPVLAGQLYLRLGPTGPYLVGALGMWAAALAATRLRRSLLRPPTEAVASPVV